MREVSEGIDLKTQTQFNRECNKTNKQIKDKQVAVIRTEHEIIHRWNEYYKEIYVKEETTIDIHEEYEILEMTVKTEELSKEEMENTLW